MADSPVQAQGGDLLILMQWLSPSFPIGSFAWSQGVERAIERGDIHDAESLADWLRAVLIFGGGRADATMLIAAMDPLADPVALTATARALAPSAERLAETAEQGAAFAATVTALGGARVEAAPLPVAVGVAARRLSLAPTQVAEFYLQALAGTLVLAAVRFVPLGQTEGQRVLAGLRADIARAAAEAAAMRVDEIVSAVPGADLAAMEHEAMTTRMFRS